MNGTKLALAAAAIPALLEEREGHESMTQLATELNVSRRLVVAACRALRHHGYVVFEGGVVSLTEAGWEVVRERRRLVPRPLGARRLGRAGVTEHHVTFGPPRSPAEIVAFLVLIVLLWALLWVGSFAWEWIG